VYALLLVKEHSKRLPGKNVLEFNGKPMFIWNLEKCKELFSQVYVSSDSDFILKLAESHGAIAIKRDASLCGDCPDIPVYQHAIQYMPGCKAIVAVHANNPTIEKDLIRTVKQIVELGVPEVMTSKPIVGHADYHKQSSDIYGSIRGISKERLKHYPDPYKPRPEVMVVDHSIEIETQEDFNAALCQ